MVVTKIRLYRESGSNLLKQEIIYGSDGLSQNNACTNEILVVVDGFELASGELLRIAYEEKGSARSVKEVLNYTLMNDNRDGTYSQEAPYEVTNGKPGATWDISLQIVSGTVEKTDTLTDETTTSYMYKECAANTVGLNVNNVIKDKDNKYPTLHDFTTYAIPNSEKGEPNGVAPLDGNKKIPVQYLPEDIGTGGGSGSGVSRDEVEEIATTKASSASQNALNEANQYTDGKISEASVALKDYVDKEIATFDITKIVDELPEEGLPNREYFVRKSNSTDPNADPNDLFDEYAWINRGTEEAPDWGWEFKGTKKLEIDLTDYVKFTDIASKGKAGVVKTDNSFGVSTTYAGNRGFLSTVPASKNDITEKTETYCPITPKLLDHAFKAAATDNKETWTDEDKAAACATIGAAKKTDLASYINESSVGTAGGVAPLGFDGRIPSDYLPADIGTGGGEGTTNVKELVVVSVDTLVGTTGIDTFKDLSKAYASGDIAIIVQLGTAYGIVSAVSVNKNADGNVTSAAWSVVSSTWMIGEETDDTTGIPYMSSSRIEVFGIQYDGATLKVGRSSYPLIDNPASQEDIAQALSDLELITVVGALPTTGETNKLYLVPKQEGSGTDTDKFDEYAWVYDDKTRGFRWENVGSISLDTSLTDYVKKTDIATDKNYGVVKADNKYGIGQSTIGLYIAQATLDEIKTRESPYKPITPSRMDAAFKQCLTNSRYRASLDDNEKSNVRAWLGAAGSDDIGTAIDEASVDISTDAWEFTYEEDGVTKTVTKKVALIDENGSAIGGDNSSGTKLYMHEYVRGEYILRILTNVSTPMLLEGITTETMYVSARIRDKIANSSYYTWRNPLSMVWDKDTIMYTYVTGEGAISYGYPYFIGYTETITEWK